MMIRYSHYTLGLVFFVRDVYHVCFMLTLYSFALYMKEMLGVSGKIANVATILTRIIMVLALIFDVLSPVTGFGLNYRNGLWSDSVINPYNVFYCYIVTILFAMLFFYSKRLIRSVRFCLIITASVVAVIMTYQGILNINTFTSITYILPILVVMILLHSKPFDDVTGSLSADSFDGLIKQNFKSKTSMDYMVLRLNMGVLKKIPPELGKVMNSFWHTTFKDALLFNLERDLYVLAIPRSARNGNTEEKIKELVAAKFHKYYLQFQIHYKVLGIFDIDFVDNEDDLLGIITYLLASMEENTILMVDDKKREELSLFKSIKSNLEDIEKMGDLDDPRVLVYCQPIRNMNTQTFDTGEALMRLTIPGHGLVMPGMFITIAEQYGHIHALTKIMLNKVCAKIKEFEEEGYIIKRISVNFTASEIKTEGICDEILSIIDKYGIAPSKIGIELTESQTESDFKIVKEKIEKLRAAGMTVYLDDVGTGYSNLDRIVRYDVDVVKFDRFFILEAERDQRVSKMIRHLSKAFRDLNYQLLYEGIETEENEALCLECGADYIQGFMYSKPIPIDDIRDFLVK